MRVRELLNVLVTDSLGRVGCTTEEGVSALRLATLAQDCNLRAAVYIQPAVMRRAAPHWPEYAIEATCLGLFMISAATMTTVLQHPSSPLAGWSSVPMLRRVPMGVAMGLTSAALIYSPLGTRSGAHMNPAVTLTFLWLRKIAPIDAAGYVLAQFAGALAGIAIATVALAGLPAHPSVNYAATVPGSAGLAIAFGAELLISFVLMSVVLRMSNTPHLARFTGIGASLLVATYIIVEAPVSGMSMNPARTLGSNLFASLFSAIWIYFVAPPVGMLLAGEWYARRHGQARVRCAKLHHPVSAHCIFHCGHQESVYELERSL
jgi:aquaporin Z